MMMTYAYELIRQPNQQFNTNINGSNFEFRFRSFRGSTYADVSINGELVIAGVKCVANVSLFPHSVNSLAGGVFMFECPDDVEPIYQNFGTPACSFVLIQR
jgi:hypothetical protein